MDNKLRTKAVLLATTIACIFFAIMPFSSSLLYPITLFVTYVHEMCHALAAIITGGHVYGITISPDMSGTTTTSGGVGWLISSAGYVGTVFIGLISIHLIRVHSGLAPVILIAFVFIMAIAILFTLGNSFFGTIWGCLIGIGLCVLLNIGPKFLIELVTTFISIQLLLNAFYDLKTLFILSGTGVHTDALNMQNDTGIPAVVWASIWISISVYATYKVLFR